MSECVLISGARVVSPSGLPVEDRVLVLADGVLAGRGRLSGFPVEYAGVPRCPVQGRLVAPGLVNRRTRPPFGGNQGDPFAARAVERVWAGTSPRVEAG